MRDVNKEAKQGVRDRRIGEFVNSWGEESCVRGLEGGTLVDVRVRLPTEEDPSTLLVIRASGKQGKVVAFVGAFSVGDAVLAWRARCVAHTMKWRPDVPWKDRVSK